MVNGMMSKLSNHNNGFKLIMMVIDILFKYASLKQLKHGTCSIGAFFFFRETLRGTKVTQTDKGTPSYLRHVVEKHKL